MLQKQTGETASYDAATRCGETMRQDDVASYTSTYTSTHSITCRTPLPSHLTVVRAPGSSRVAPERESLMRSAVSSQKQRQSVISPTCPQPCLYLFHLRVCA